MLSDFKTLARKIKKILNEEISMQIIFETKEIKQSVQKKIANYISKK